jgi:hypothetical protein
VLFTPVDPSGQARVSDHCPIAVVFESDGLVEPREAYPHVAHAQPVGAAAGGEIGGLE